MQNLLPVDLAKLPIPREYRIHNGKVEARLWGTESQEELRWSEVSSEQLRSHVLCNTAVARWLERNLGWRRLLWACLGNESDGQGSNQTNRPSTNQQSRGRQIVDRQNSNHPNLDPAQVCN